MASNYNIIRSENERRYGTDIPRIGPMLLSDRYDNRIHFIYELLQNAEDALKRRACKTGSLSIQFSLFPDHLRVSHFGQIFNEQDVRGICGIGESTKSKDLTSIGRFGIGFKAVYAFTDSPEIHSGDEHFAIDSYVWPRSISSISAKENETVFILSFRKEDEKAFVDVLEGLKNLGPRTLLFLREIDQIEWSASTGESGVYMREAKDVLDGCAREVMVLGQESGRSDVEERWIVFSEIAKHGEISAGFVEAAFKFVYDPQKKASVFVPVNDATLVVFFPTVVSLNLGFLIQGPYRTTPSRDNVPIHDQWNEYLVQETASLVERALSKFTEFGLMSVELLETLPIDSTKFVLGSRFFGLYHTVLEAFRKQRMLPTYNGGYALASEARLARGQDLRELFSSEQLSLLLEIKSPLHWLIGSLTRERTPQLYQYLLNDLAVPEIEPYVVATRISGEFLRQQTDEWLAKFYLFFNGQSARWPLIKAKPIFRVESGDMELGWHGAKPRVFLPSHSRTDFLTIKRSVFSFEKVPDFLRSLGLRQADLVDDVINNVLPRYKPNDGKIEAPSDYAADVERIINAFDTDSKEQQGALIADLKESCFLSVVDAKTKKNVYTTSKMAYIPTEKLFALFSEIEGVYFINDEKCPFFRGERARNFLEAVGSLRRLAIIPAEQLLSPEERSALIKANGGSWGTWIDWDILGLDKFIEIFAQLSDEDKLRKSALLWELLCDLVDYRGASILYGSCSSSYYRKKSSFEFPARFVNRLNTEKWVIGPDGQAYLPSEICFEMVASTWKSNAALLSVIKFRPSIINELERQVGLEPGFLALLNKHGISTVEALKKVLNIVDKAPVNLSPMNNILPSPSVESSSHQPDSTKPNLDLEDDASPAHSHSGGDHKSLNSAPPSNVKGELSGKQSPFADSKREFVSYVSVGHDVGASDGHVYEENMELEGKAIDIILLQEPTLKRAPLNNKGYDLYQADSGGLIIKWVEVKSISGLFKTRPAVMSKAQFETATKRGAAYWLYVVENAHDSAKTQVIKIQDPAGRAQSFAYDCGWALVAGDLCEQNSSVEDCSLEGDLETRLVATLRKATTALTAKELAVLLSAGKIQITRLMYGSLRNQVVRDLDNRWSMKK